MTAPWPPIDRRAVVAALVPPAVVGALALAAGYPLPAVGSVPAVAAGGVALAAVGLAGWRCRARGRPGAAALAAVGVAGAAAWSLLAPGPGAARVGDAVVTAGTPVLARFVGVAPWVLIVVGAAAAVEPAVPGLGTGAAGGDGVARARTRRGALRAGAAGGVALAALAVLPAYLRGPGYGDLALFGFGAGGTLLAGTAVGYAFARHRLRAPVALLGAVTAAAAVSVLAGGSPRGLPTAWLVWLLPGLLLGGVEALGRRV